MRDSYQSLHFETNCLLYVQWVQPPSELELWSDCLRGFSSRILYSESVIDGCHEMNTLTKLSPSLAPNNRLHTQWVTRGVMALSVCRANIVSSCLKPYHNLGVRLLLISDGLHCFLIGFSAMKPSLAFITPARKYFWWMYCPKKRAQRLQSMHYCNNSIHRGIRSQVCTPRYDTHKMKNIRGPKYLFLHVMTLWSYQYSMGSPRPRCEQWTCCVSTPCSACSRWIPRTRASPWWWSQMPHTEHSNILWWEIKLENTNCVKTDSSSKPVLSYATAVSCNNCAVLKLSSSVSTFL